MPNFLSFSEVTSEAIKDSMREFKEVDNKAASKAHERLDKVKDEIKEVVDLFRKAGMETPEQFVADQIRASGMPRAKEEKKSTEGKERPRTALIIKELKKGR